MNAPVLDASAQHPMFHQLRERYEELKASRPGERFKKLHERRSQRGTGRTVLRLGIAIAVIAAGVAMLVLPGPGILGMCVGASLLAQELEIVAKALDWAEVQIRGFF